MARGSFGLSIERDYIINESLLRGNNATDTVARGFVGDKLVSSYGSSNNEPNN
jgi:hypothetical protein